MKPGCIYIDSLPADAVAIPDYPKAFATPDGRIYTKHGRLKLRRFGRNSCGYPICGLRGADGKCQFVMVHRIIAQLFVPGDNRLTVNHIDMNKENCAATNLEWITHSDNHKKGHVLKPEWSEKISEAVGRAIIAINPATGERREFASGRKAALWVGNINAAGNISRVLSQPKLAYGYKWERA